MKNHKTYFLFVLVISFSLTLAIEIASAATGNLTVPAGGEKTQSVSLEVDDHVLIQFSVVGSPGSTIFFSLDLPDKTTLEFGQVGKFGYNFISNATGDYTMHFVNNDSSESKLVTLSYEIDHYLLGMPQMLTMAVFIAVVCVGMVAVFVLTGKRM